MRVGQIESSKSYRRCLVILLQISFGVLSLIFFEDLWLGTGYR